MNLEYILKFHFWNVKKKKKLFHNILILLDAPVWIYLECQEHIVRTHRLPDHAIFNLLQEIKDDLEPSTRSHAIPAI